MLMQAHYLAINFTLKGWMIDRVLVAFIFNTINLGNFLTNCILKTPTGQVFSDRI